jgi:translation elongation factor aEF-1 beta
MEEAAIKLKIMPQGTDTDLKPIKEQGEEKIKSQGGLINNYEEQEVAFGLKALIATISWPEEKDTEIVENIFKQIKGVSSVDIIDYRRALG